MVVVDHHGAKIYRIGAASSDASKREVAPYDPHHFLHHLTHKEQSQEQDQRATEDAGFYKRIGDALADGTSTAEAGAVNAQPGSRLLLADVDDTLLLNRTCGLARSYFGEFVSNPSGDRQSWDPSALDTQR